MIIKMFYLFSTLFKGLSSLAVTYGKWRNAMVQWKNVVVQWKNVVERLQIPSLGSFCSSSLISTQISVILIRVFCFVFFPPPAAFTGTNRGSCHLKLVNFEAHENHISHETQGLSHRHLVVRRGKPFKVTLLFGGQAWNPHTEVLSLQVWLGTNKQGACIWSNPSCQTMRR